MNTAGNNQPIDRMLSSVPAFHRDPAVSITPLPGGITNLNYRVRTAGGSVYVVKAFGKHTEKLQVNRTNEFAAARAAFRRNISPRPIHIDVRQGFLVTQFVRGPTLTAPAIRKTVNLTAVIDAVKRIHRVSASLSAFSVFRTIRSYHETLVGMSKSFPADYRKAMDIVSAVETYYHSFAIDPCVCHNDLLSANFIRSPDGIRVVDWEYAGLGDPYFDLGNLAANNDFSNATIREMSFVYHNGNSEAHTDRIILMMAASCVREALWSEVQRHHSALSFDFREYAGLQYKKVGNIMSRYPAVFKKTRVGP